MLSKEMHKDLVANSTDKEYDSISVWFTHGEGNEVADNAIDIATLESIDKSREDLDGFDEFIRMTLKHIE